MLPQSQDQIRALRPPDFDLGVIHLLVVIGLFDFHILRFSSFVKIAFLSPSLRFVSSDIGCSLRRVFYLVIPCCDEGWLEGWGNAETMATMRAG